MTEKERNEEIGRNMQKLKATAQDGDLIVRLNDDFVSEQLRFFNETDKSYSHSGIIVTKDSTKMVCSVLPGLPGKSPVVYAPIDSFINPKTNTLAGLFRYDLSPTEREAFLNNINALTAQKLVFDSTLGIHTDDSLYCSEMIYKTLKKATNDRLKFKLSPIPPKMQNTVYLFYGGRFKRDTIAARRIIYIDNLYLIPQCKELMRFRLKYFPGQ
jgi:hypothetical protein